MDWQLAIARKKRELLTIVASLQAMMAVAALSRSGRNAVLRILRPAESTLRRLIVIVASTMEIKPAKASERPVPDFSSFKNEGKKRAPAFRLIDPRKRFEWLKPKTVVSKDGPRISVLGGAPLVPLLSSSVVLGLNPRMTRGSMPEAVSVHHSAALGCVAGASGMGPCDKHRGDGGEVVDASAITRRIEALAQALNTLPKQARRMIRMMERRKKAPPGPRCVGPIRPGLPPGYRRKHTHKIDEILWDCHGLALDRGWEPP